jgi:NADH-quinone oxidoreductase subunit M
MIGSLWLTVLVPIIFMPIVYLLGRSMGKNVSWVALIPLLYSTLDLGGLLGKVAENPVGEYFMWLPEIRFGLYADSLSLPIATLIALLGVIMAIYSNADMAQNILKQYGGENNKAHGTYYALYLGYVASMIGVVLSTNLFEFYFFFELMIIPSYLLINVYGSGEKEKIGLSYLLWSIVGAVLFVTGALSAYALTGSYELSSLASLSGSPYAGFVVITMLLGFGVKLAMFGLHVWQPAAYSEAPTSISALLSPAMSGLAAYSIVRMLLPISGIMESYFSYTLIWGLATMIYGGLNVLAQDDMKQMLAYSSMSQMGYIFIGVASATTMGVTGSMLHYISHGFGKAALFLAVGAVAHQTGTRSIKELGGLAAKMPITAVCFIIGAFNLAGIPPTVGFPSKLMIFMGAFGPGVFTLSAEFYVALAALLSTALTVGYTMSGMRRIFFGPLPESLADVKEAPWIMTVPMIILCVLSIVLGLFPAPILDPLMEAVAGLLA